MRKKYIRVTVEWLKEHYDKANCELFNGELGDCTFVVKQPKRVTSKLASCVMHFNNMKYELYTRKYYKVLNTTNDERLYINKENFAKECNPVITFLDINSFTEKALYTTLVHEMCHYYTYMNGYYPKHSHGKEFREIANVISNKTNEIFPLTYVSSEEMSEIKLDAFNKNIKWSKKSKPEYIITLLSNGNNLLTFTDSKKLINKIIDIENTNKNKVIKIINHNICQTLFNNGYTSIQPLKKCRNWDINSKDLLMKKIMNNEKNYQYLN